MTKQLQQIAFFSLMPVPLILAAALWGGAWAVLAFFSMTFVTAALDHVLPVLRPPGPRDGGIRTADRLSLVLVAAHFAVLITVVWSLSSGQIGGLSAVATFLAAGLFMGQVSNSNAHELIHRSARGLRRTGVAVYVSLLFGHHASAHPLVHHVHVATDRDPNSARLGESYWQFLRRAWIGSFRAGLAAESKRHPSPLTHPYSGYVAGAALMATAAMALFGPVGVIVYLMLTGYAVAQLLLSDYVQHYGLRRAIGPDGRPEPVGPGHSWNSPHRVSSAMMLNAPRHSDHHAHPMRPYPQLELPMQGRMLPRSLPIMATLALFPRAWRRIMDPRLASNTDG